MGWSSLDSIRSNRALSAGTLVQVCGEALDGPLRAGERPARGSAERGKNWERTQRVAAETRSPWLRDRRMSSRCVSADNSGEADADGMSVANMG